MGQAVRADLDHMTRLASAVRQLVESLEQIRSVTVWWDALPHELRSGVALRVLHSDFHSLQRTRDTLEELHGRLVTQVVHLREYLYEREYQHMRAYLDSVTPSLPVYRVAYTTSPPRDYRSGRENTEQRYCPIPTTRATSWPGELERILESDEGAMGRDGFQRYRS